MTQNLIEKYFDIVSARKRAEADSGLVLNGPTDFHFSAGRDDSSGWYFIITIFFGECCVTQSIRLSDDSDSSQIIKALNELHRFMRSPDDRLMIGDELRFDRELINLTVKKNA